MDREPGNQGNLKMNPEQKAIDAWFDSTEGKRFSDAESLNCSEGQGQYLRNRLLRAFQAGMEAGEKIQRERVIQTLSDLIA